MYSLAVIVPYYKRKELTTLCFKNLERQSNKYGFDVFVCGDDKSIVPSSFKYFEFKNNPLGKKNNYLLSKTISYDGVVIVGSDDFLSDSIFDVYQTLDLTKDVYYGFDNCHIYSVWDNILGTDFSYTRSGHTIGVGRLWTKPTLEKMNYNIWTDSKNNGLDTDSKNNMAKKGIKEVSLPYNGHFILDVKQDCNITNPKIVKTCNKVEGVNLINKKLGVISKEILSLKVGDTRQIKRNMKKQTEIKKVKIEIIKEVAGMSVGDTRLVGSNIARRLINRGVAVESKPKQTRKRTKKVENDN